MQESNTPPGFTEHERIPLEESAQDWQVGEIKMFSDKGLGIDAAAFNAEDEKLYVLQLNALDHESRTFQDFDIVRLEDVSGEETMLDDLSEIPQDVRDGMYEVLATMLETGSASLSPAATQKLIGIESVIDMQVDELTHGFDPQMLLNDGLSNESLQEAEAFAAELDSRVGDAELMNLLVDDAAQRLAKAREDEPDNTALHKQMRLQHNELIDQTALVEPDDMATYGHDSERYSNEELRDASKQAAASEDAAIERAKKTWWQSIKDERENDQGEDKGRG